MNSKRENSQHMAYNIYYYAKMKRSWIKVTPLPSKKQQQKKQQRVGTHEALNRRNLCQQQQKTSDGSEPTG